jgi:hypothetical protein
MDILWVVAQNALPLVLAVLGILGVFLAHKLLGRLGIQRSEAIDKLIDKAVNVGINAAEVAARKHLTAKAEALTSENKMAKAVEVVMGELKQAGLTKVAQDLVVARIESALEAGGHEPGVPSDPKDS